MLVVERHDVICAQQRVIPGADLVEIIPGQRQRKFRDERQQRAEPVGAEAVGPHARSRREVDVKVVLRFRPCVGEQRLQPEQVGGGIDRPILRQPVAPAAGAEIAFIPDGQLHREGRKQHRFLPAPAQAGADGKRGLVAGELELHRRRIVRLIGRVMDDAAQHAVQRNQPPGIEAVVNAHGSFPAVAGERFRLQKFSAANFVVAVRVTAARQPDAQVGVLAQRVADAQFRVEIDRGNRQAQRQIGAVKVGGVEITKGVRGQRCLPLQRAVVANLNQLARRRINLGKRAPLAGPARQPDHEATSDKTKHTL